MILHFKWVSAFCYISDKTCARLFLLIWRPCLKPSRSVNYDDDYFTLNAKSEPKIDSNFLLTFFDEFSGKNFFSLLPSYFISLSLFLISFSWMLWWRTGKIPDKHLTLKLDLLPYSIYCNLFEVSMSVVLTNVRFQKTNWLNYGKCT